jgi:hypothetical protein
MIQLPGCQLVTVTVVYLKWLAPGVAQDLQIPDERAISMASNWVAGACRGRIVEAYTAAKKEDMVSANQALFQLANLLQGLPILEANSSQVNLALLKGNDGNDDECPMRAIAWMGADAGEGGKRGDLQYHQQQVGT